MRAVAVTVISTSLLLPVSVLADPPRRDDDCARARKAGRTCVLDLPAEEVGGKTAAPGDTQLRILTLGSSGSLLRVRRDFIPEIVKAADDL